MKNPKHAGGGREEIIYLFRILLGIFFVLYVKSYKRVPYVKISK